MKKPIIFAGVAAVMLAAVTYFVLLPMIKGKPAAAAVDDEPAAATAPAKRKPRRASAEPGLMYPLPERVLNLTGPTGTPHYARIELALEFERPKDAKAAPKGESKGGEGKGGPAIDPALAPVAARQAQIDDAILRIIGSKTFEDMTSAQGKDAVKDEILQTVGDMIDSPALLNVYIVRLVVQ